MVEEELGVHGGQVQLAAVAEEVVQAGQALVVALGVAADAGAGSAGLFPLGLCRSYPSGVA